MVNWAEVSPVREFVVSTDTATDSTGKRHVVASAMRVEQGVLQFFDETGSVMLAIAPAFWFDVKRVR